MTTDTNDTDKKTRPRRKAPALPLEGFVRIETILEVYPVGITTLYKDIQDGIFPGPIKKGRSSLWDAVAVREALARMGANVYVPLPVGNPDSQPSPASSSF